MVRHSLGWGSARTLAGFAVAVLLLTGFGVRQARARTPLLPLRLFRSRSVSGANAVQLLTVAAAFGFLGYRAAAAGLAMLPAAVVIGFVSVVLSARLIGRFGLRAMLVSGLVPIAVGLGLLVRLPAGGSWRSGPARGWSSWRWCSGRACCGRRANPRRIQAWPARCLMSVRI